MQRPFRAVIALVLCFLAFYGFSHWIGSAGFASAQIDPSYTPFPTGDSRFVSVQGHLGSFPKSVTVRGNYAYIGVGSEFAIVDVSNPTSPVRVGYVLIPGNVGDIEINGTYAYVSSWDAGLRIIDISNPAEPTEVGFWGVELDFRGLTVKNQFVYLASRPTGLHIVDVSNPQAPQDVASIGCVCDLVDAVVSGAYAFAIDEEGYVRAIDVFDTRAPFEVDVIKLPGYSAEDIQVSGNYLYIADWDQGVRVIDASNPMNLREVGSFPISGVTTRLAISANRAFVITDVAEGFYILNLSNPVSPTLESTYELQSFDVNVSGRFAFVTDGNHALHVLDISNPSSPKDVGQYHVLSLPGALYVKNEKAYIGDESSGLDIVDVSDFRFPEIIGNISKNYKITSVKVVSDTLYMLGADNLGSNLSIFDLTNVISSSLKSNFPVYGNDMEVEGNYAYLAGGQLIIIDISNPISPTVVSSTSDYIGSYRIAVVNSLALLTAGESGVYIVDVSNPYSPTLESVFHPLGDAMQVAAAGEFAYVTWIDYSGSNYMGITVLDILNPKAPEALGTYKFMGEPLGLTIANNFAYIISGLGYSATGDNLRIIDISDPMHPKQVGYSNLSPNGFSIGFPAAVNRSDIYVTTSDGLFVLKFHRDDIYLPFLLKIESP
jgi:hypothetical protein